jgi:hypothetical protein
MFVRLKTNFILVVIIFSLLVMNFHIGFGAANIAIDPDPISNQNPDPLSNNDLFWSEIEIISEPAKGQNINSQESQSVTIAVEGNRRYVVWTDFTNINNAGPGSDLFYRYYDGNIWSDIEIISEPIPGFDYYSSDGSEYPQITVENGKIYVVWSSRNNTNGAGTDNDIFFRCNLTGTNWEDVQILSEPIEGQNLNVETSFFPDISVENGKIYVIWGEYNNSIPGNPDSEVFFRCNLTGLNWEKEQVISEPVFGENFHTGHA